MIACAQLRLEIARSGSGAPGSTGWTGALRTNPAGNVNWLSASATSGTAPTIVTVSVSTQGLPSGVYLGQVRSEAHTSELQSPDHLVCRLLLAKTTQRTPVINFTMPLCSKPL